MVSTNLTPKQKITVALVTNILLFGAISALGFLGLTLEQTLLIFSTTVSLEAIGLFIFIEIFLSKSSKTLSNLEKNIEKIKEDEEKKEAPLLYIGHQIKLLQHELNILRKSSILKSPSQSHAPKVHI